MTGCCDPSLTKELQELAMIAKEDDIPLNVIIPNLENNNDNIFNDDKTPGNNNDSSNNNNMESEAVHPDTGISRYVKFIVFFFVKLYLCVCVCVWCVKQNSKKKL